MDKSYVTMEQKVCFVCGEKFDTGNILLDRHLCNRFERNTVTGYGHCPECQNKLDEGFVFLIVVDESKSPNEKEPWRTGEIVTIKKEVCADIFTDCQIEAVGFITTDAFEKIKTMVQQIQEEQDEKH